MAINTDPEHLPEKENDMAFPNASSPPKEESSSRFSKPSADDPPPGASPTSPSTPPAHKGHPSQPWENYPKEKIALPTVGRVVYFYHPSYGGQPLAAIVAAVMPNEGGGYTVNLGVLNPDGTGGPAMNVPHESERLTPDTPYWDWMPYQKGQAAKTEQLQAELDAKARGE